MGRTATRNKSILGKTFKRLSRSSHHCTKNERKIDNPRRKKNMTFIDYMGKNVIEQRTAVNVLLVVALPILSKTVFRMKAWKKNLSGVLH